MRVGFGGDLGGVLFFFGCCGQLSSEKAKLDIYQSTFKGAENMQPLRGTGHERSH